MRLLKTNYDPSRGLELVSRVGDKIPKYAILSHTWGDYEILFEDVGRKTVTEREAWPKVAGALRQALSDGLDYIWIDTCCINKDSSAELQEAINSMYTWYSQADVCYAYLADVAVSLESEHFAEYFSKSRWFTRGWTLQELLAPHIVVFFAQDWAYMLGTKQNLVAEISQRTGIEAFHVLNGYSTPEDVTVAMRMSWAASRQVSREEDLAYCLLDLSEIHMPLLYGEGGYRAFQRLQEEIMKSSDDQTLFAWIEPHFTREPYLRRRYGMLAATPASLAFPGSTHI